MANKDKQETSYQRKEAHKRELISLSLGDQITTTLATSVLPVCSEENS